MIQNRDDELEVFKCSVSLTEYAEACGYVLDKKESSRNSHVMRDGAGDKIIIARGRDGHDIYFSVRDERDNGSIIDFVQKRQGLNLGEVRRELRPWAGIKAKPTPTSRKRKTEADRIERPEPIERDKAAMIAASHRLAPYSGAYLESERKLSARTVEAFAPAIRQDERNNVCFLHRDSTGQLTGWEKKNRGFTGFASGGEKSFFWHMPEGERLQRLVITESAIDAMSYHERHGQAGDCYISFGGSMNDTQRAELERIARKVPSVTIATDNDAQGHQFAQMVKQWRPDAQREVPEHGKDWNDELRHYHSATSSYGMSG